MQKFDAAAQLLIHREQDQNRLEYRLLLLTQILLLLIGVQNHADMGCQICLSAHIEEIPELIHRQQRMLVIRPRMIDEILERLNLLVSNRLDKIKHTALVRLERGCNMFENQSRHRMQRHDISDHILRRDARDIHHTTTGLMKTTIEIALHLRPILLCRSFRFKRRADEIKRDIVRQRNPDIDEAVARLLPRLICLRKEMIRLMRYRNEEKRLCIHELRQLLKICQTLTIHTEIIRELIPDKDEFDIVLLNDIRKPRNQTVNIELHHGKALSVGESRNAFHEVTHLIALAQAYDNILDHHPAKRCCPLRLLQLAVNEPLVCVILFQPRDDTLLERMLSFVKTTRMELRLHTLLHGKEQIARRMRRTRVAVHRYDAIACLLVSEQFTKQITLMRKCLIVFPVGA